MPVCGGVGSYVFDNKKAFPLGQGRASDLLLLNEYWTGCGVGLVSLTRGQKIHKHNQSVAHKVLIHSGGPAFDKLIST